MLGSCFAPDDAQCECKHHGDKIIEMIMEIKTEFRITMLVQPTLLHPICTARPTLWSYLSASPVNCSGLSSASTAGDVLSQLGGASNVAGLTVLVTGEGHSRLPDMSC
jgi:hypothetical protein